MATADPVNSMAEARAMPASPHELVVDAQIAQILDLKTVAEGIEETDGQEMAAVLSATTLPVLQLRDWLAEVAATTS